jgi:hypothetical protein
MATARKEADGATGFWQMSAYNAMTDQTRLPANSHPPLGPSAWEWPELSLEVAQNCHEGELIGKCCPWLGTRSLTWIINQDIGDLHAGLAARKLRGIQHLCVGRCVWPPPHRCRMNSALDVPKRRSRVARRAEGGRKTILQATMAIEI